MDGIVAFLQMGQVATAFLIVGDLLTAITVGALALRLVTFVAQRAAIQRGKIPVTRRRPKAKSGATTPKQFVRHPAMFIISLFCLLAYVLVFIVGFQSTPDVPTVVMLVVLCLCAAGLCVLLNLLAFFEAGGSIIQSGMDHMFSILFSLILICLLTILLPIVPLFVSLFVGEPD